VVVAMTFVIDARSNGVSSDVLDAPESNVSVPSASVHSAPALHPTSTVAAGKTRASTAPTTTRRAASVPGMRQPGDGDGGARADEDVPSERDRRPTPHDSHDDEPGEHAGERLPLADRRRERPEKKRAEDRPRRVREDREPGVEHRALHPLRR